MLRLDLTLATPAENLALDEALLDWAEEENEEWEFLRLWESPEPMVVVGRSTRVGQEVDAEACRVQRVPILRRSSGGAAIVAGRGCLMYAVILSYRRRPELKDIGAAHRTVLGRLADVFRPLLPAGSDVRHAGSSDLVYVSENCAAPRKFSGNSMRAKRTHLLYHGTLLYDFDLPLIGSCLRMPPRVPDYRAGRSHGDFVMNLPLDRRQLTAAVDAAWPAHGALRDWPSRRTARLAAERFGRDCWNFEFA